MNVPNAKKAMTIALGSIILQASPISLADQVILDDLVVDGSICVGQDCVNGESFGFDTIRLKENNLRIRAIDTSNSASFPSTDWQITFNDSSNGGANKFSIDDIDTGRTPFTIEGGSPSHSLYVDDGGRVGLGTSTPVTDIHVKSGNTPTLRLEQDGSSGFTPQTWDVAGNEANFFIRDATNGSTLPFKIKPGAPSNALYVDSTGNIGLGTTSPEVPLHAKKTGSTAKTLLSLENDGPARLQLKNNQSGGEGDTWTFNATSSNLRFAHAGVGAVAGTEFTISKNGNATLAGVLTENSDVNAKQGIEPIDQRMVLAKVMTLPIAEWSYKDAPESRHVGPMAQDFYRSFGLGNTDKGIASIDTAGIALAAIQGVQKEKNAQITQLRAEKDGEIAALQAELRHQNKRMMQLEMALAKVLRNQISAVEHSLAD